MYGSNFCTVTLYPLESNSFATDAEIIPLPNDDTTPPVTNMYLVSIVNMYLIFYINQTAKIEKNQITWCIKRLKI